MTDIEHLPTYGVVRVGEITTRVEREAIVADDYHNAQVTGAVDAYTKTDLWVREQIRVALPYDDTRALEFLHIWLGDRIREVQTPATTGNSDADR
jgi:hypothetical protein